MIEIGNTLVSLDVISTYFTCDLEACKGACCVEGESGAPLDESELLILDEIYQSVKPFLTPEGVKTIEKHGVYIIDSDGDYVTPLIANKQCAYSYIDNSGTTRCAIENAFNQKVVGFRKPLSCFLYPIRITAYKNYDAVNYDRNKICYKAEYKGKILNQPVYRFLKEPLIQKYGLQWYQQLEEAAINLPDELKQKAG